MKKCLSLLAVCLAACQITTAQKVLYTPVSDDPTDYKKTSIGLSVGNLDTYRGVSIGIGGRAETVIMDRILAYASYNWAWFDQVGSETNYYGDYPEPKGGRKGYTNLTIGGSYFLLDWKSKQKVRMTLTTRRMGNVNVEHYTMVPGTTLHMLGIDAGYSKESKPNLLGGGQKDSMFHYQSLDNRLDIPLNGNFFMGGTDQPAGNPTSLYTTSNSFNFYLGARHRSVRNLIVEFEDIGKRSSTLVSDIYCDLIYSPQTTITHVIDKDGAEWKLYAPSKAFNHVGYKLGMVRRSNRTKFMTFNFEIGKIPGLVTGTKSWAESGGYIAIGITLCLNSKIHIGPNHKPLPKKQNGETNTNPSI